MKKERPCRKGMRSEQAQGSFGEEGRASAHVLLCTHSGVRGAWEPACTGLFLLRLRRSSPVLTRDNSTRGSLGRAGQEDV